MANPKLILLDEPTAGVSPPMCSILIEVIENLRQSGITFVIIEHDMEVVFKMADHITVMAFGKVFAAGTPEEIASNAGVKEIYFGSDELELS